jgi:UDP-3-O-[3-hydroxymyristoyl] N-acetylglucosamine deacetylase / 3-hydroxyacyl-[acyl-carrier-protein] dehydratase
MPRVANQHTIQKPVSFEGIGLHSGNPVKMRFLPADPGSGLRFRRVDLDGQPEIPASFEHVSETNRSTTLTKGNVKIHTVEHVLATFHGFGIDNAVVELDSNEPPIGDGSARAYCELIQKAGIVEQAERREPYRLTEPIEFQSGDTIISAFPHDCLKISCTSSDRNGRFTQFYSVEVSPEVWQRDIAHARTFAFFEEIEYLFKNGLIKGGSLENAVVIRDDAVLTTEPLRYPEEFVRHKILDIIGDLTLVGRPVNAHIVAVKPSHGANVELARRVHAQLRKPAVAVQTFAPPPPEETENAPTSETAAPGTPVMDVNEVMKFLPHRYPFLLIDKVTKIEGDKITAIKNVTINEGFFEGHFPGQPIMPGVLQLEAIAQVAGLLMLRQLQNSGKLAYFMAANDVKWRKPVVPGDRLTIDVELTRKRGKIGRAKGVCTVDGEIVSEGEVTFMLGDA